MKNLVSSFYCRLFTILAICISSSFAVEFEDAKKLYDKPCKIIRRSIVNAVNLSYDVHAGAAATEDPLVRLNAGIGHYWDRILVAPFKINTAFVGEIYPILAFHSLDASISDDYPKFLLAFHGTKLLQWLGNMSGGVGFLNTGSGRPLTRECLSGHLGFISAGSSVPIDVIQKSMMSLLPPDCSFDMCQIILTGHSLGGAVASVLALRLLESFENLNNARHRIVTLTMGQPPVWSKLRSLSLFGKSNPHERYVELMGKNNLLRLVTCASEDNIEDMVALPGTHPGVALGYIGFGLWRFAKGLVSPVLAAKGFKSFESFMEIGIDPFRGFFDHSATHDSHRPVFIYKLHRKDYNELDVAGFMSTFPHAMKFYEAAIMEGLKIAPSVAVTSAVSSADIVLTSSVVSGGSSGGSSQPIARPLGSDLPDIAKGHEADYARFMGGKLIYRPTPGSDVGMIEFRFADVINPTTLEGTFDLSRCGDTGKRLSIATGYRKGKKSENVNKIEVWIVPKFVAEKELATTAGHLAPIMGSFTTPIGLFWSWGNWDNMNWYDYLTYENFEALADGKDLYKKWSVALPPPQGGAKTMWPGYDLYERHGASGPYPQRLRPQWVHENYGTQAFYFQF